MLTHAITVDNEDQATALVIKLALNGVWFTFDKQAENAFEITVKKADAHHVDELPHTEYALIQEGGSSGERYLHVHESNDTALEDRVDCTKNGAYRTSPIVVVPAMVGVLGEHVYGVIDELLQELNNLDYVDGDDDDGEPS